MGCEAKAEDTEEEVVEYEVGDTVFVNDLDGVVNQGPFKVVRKESNNTGQKIYTLTLKDASIDPEVFRERRKNVSSSFSVVTIHCRIKPVSWGFVSPSWQKLLW